MPPASGRGPERQGEITGFLLSLAFAASTAVRDVYLGGLFQRMHPLLVALTAFGLCVLVFLPVALVSDRAGLAALLRRPAPLFWMNATTGLAWLSFFSALRSLEPALVQILFYGIGPLGVRWIDHLVPGAPSTVLTSAERRLHRGLLLSLLLAAGVALGGRSGLGAQSPSSALLGVTLAVVGGVSISVSALLGRALNDTGLRPATVLATRFPGAVLLAAALALASRAPLGEALTPGVAAWIALASFLLIVLPNYVNQVGVALAAPVTVRAVLALGPVLVFGLQWVEGRLSSSAWTLAAAIVYAVFAVATALARRRAITATTGLRPHPDPRPAPAPTR
jgi:drug/metabolite transporter (DMT)-like permease